MSNSGVEVYLGLGGNIGDPSITIEETLASLSRRPGIKVLTRSPFYRTPPWGKTDQSDFINACATIHTTLSPQKLLKTCLEVEKRMGRERGERWGPRIIDIDILSYGDEQVHEDDLSIPHPLIAERAFVLVPLKDVAPDFTLNGEHIDEMLEKIDLTGIEALHTAYAQDDAFPQEIAS
ncbi:2-amino-4-hydroxy-6-hydroxymethyldihydropteridinediphosphokinase [Cohaesibacter sp. ES.047]|uniref:2-amino-4-hydroxy-6- hydroxymethyldihydropteridine diphosphokinase n=1 Tax=Cohaesibacter sp. ES.047 TaxID=1798205 RepID=UPI000BB9313A|nr:2-amino-4-hydroxy-6-hydroxymethyldihydropteridine diphosphokinase [Cohaesibacter sp. ES.047]SNY93977.1 2-amino-4-hydroxy-6-hydroxymethyldihydropteridinediphosphokinase [Cohaesibacter sp. ES.047]